MLFTLIMVIITTFLTLVLSKLYFTQSVALTKSKRSWYTNAVKTPSKTDFYLHTQQTLSMELRKCSSLL